MSGLKTSTLGIIYFPVIALLMGALLFLNPYSVTLLLSDDGVLHPGTSRILAIVSIGSLCGLGIYAFAIYQWYMRRLYFPALLADISLFVISFVVVVAVLEGIFRGFYDHRLTKYIYAYNETLGMNYMRPNLSEKLISDEYETLLETDSIGLRRNDSSKSWSDDDKVIMLIGDSFVQALSVDIEDTAANILQQSLNMMIPRAGNYQVINIARSGWTPTSEREFLGQNIDRFNPDLVVLFVYIGNDVLETMTSIELKRGSLTVNSWHKMLASPRNPLHSLRYLVSIIRDHNKWPGGRPMQPFYNPNYRHGEANIFRKDYSPEIIEAYDKIFSEILQMEKICKESGAQMKLVIIPTKEQVHEDKLTETVKVLGIDMEKMDMQKPQRIFAEFAQKNGIPLLNLAKRLRTEAREQRLYFDKDSHWNENGNAVVADELQKFLHEQGAI